VMRGVYGLSLPQGASQHYERECRHALLPNLNLLVRSIRRARHRLSPATVIVPPETHALRPHPRLPAAAMWPFGLCKGPFRSGKIETESGRSGLIVSPLSLGTMTFGPGAWGADEATSRGLFHAYRNAGGNFIDTADIYSGGASEKLVGIQ
jgi:Aldo/keto reductase family